MSAKGQTGKNTHHAEYVWQNSVTALRISEDIRHNTAYTKLSASGPRNSPHTRESWCMSLVKLVQKGKKWPNKPKRPTKLDKCVKRSTKLEKLVERGQQNWPTSSKRSTKHFSKADQINSVQFLVHEFSTVMCRNLARQCADFPASAWEGIWHSGWKFSILGFQLVYRSP